MNNTDRIEKRVTLRAPRTRVWNALSDASQFAQWFGITLDGPFAAGATVHGRISNPKYEHLKAEFQVETINPESYFSYRWHPYTVDPNIDYSKEPTTLVEFTLEDAGDATVLTVVESGFDRVPIARRAEAFRMNDGGWTSQIRNIEKYVSAS